MVRINSSVSRKPGSLKYIVNEFEELQSYNPVLYLGIVKRRLKPASLVPQSAGLSVYTLTLCFYTNNLNLLIMHSPVSLTKARANARNVRIYYPFWQYTILLYFDLYLYSAYAAHYTFITYISSLISIISHDKSILECVCV